MLQTYSFLKRNLLLFIALTSFISLQAQTAADYKLTTTATPSTCAKNGTITSTVTKADGTAIDMSAIDNIQYDVRNAGTDASVTGGYKVTNYAAQLPPGSYDVYVMITHNNAVQVNLAALNISIANQYVPLTLTEYGFRSFSSRVTTTFPSGASQNSLNCYPTGAYKIYVKG